MRYIIDTTIDPEGWSGMHEAKGRIIAKLGAYDRDDGVTCDEALVQRDHALYLCERAR